MSKCIFYKDTDDYVADYIKERNEAIYMMKSPNADKVFQKDLHALRIVINIVKNIKENCYDN